MSRHKYKGILCYDGSQFLGFERQSEGKTVQGCLEEQLSFLCGKPTSLKAAGRTDKGVSARGQVFAFECEELSSPESFRLALNRLLPRSIMVESLEEVPASFDPRHSCKGKRYEYRFTYGDKLPLQSLTTAFIGCRDDFDEKAFLEAIHMFEGHHHFADFTCKEEDVDAFWRDVHIEEAEVDGKSRTGHVVFSGNGFMTYMIRFMMGTAFRCAFHKMEPSEIAPHLVPNEERHVLSSKAPAEGLTLLEVLY